MKRVWYLVAAFGCGWMLSEAFAQEELPREPVPAVRAAGDNVQLLTRGPVHEAFAQAVTPATDVGLTVRKEPPPQIEEIPPAQRPAGDEIAWIPGYWGWDDERNDFIWISGIWRAIPPGREWVPGYWTKVPEGFQWISGYWADTAVQEVEYLPEPPEIVDAAPSTPAPSGNEIWVPGIWMWQQNKYVWRAGYWSHGDPRWVWTNAHYVYTPRGYLYVKGYWDFTPDQRGVLFAPVYFNGPLDRNYVYSPRMVVNTAGVLDNLFLRPTYRHYYFGDYYGAPYRGRGILPYFVFNNSRYGYDSIYSFRRWQNRNDRDWERHVESRYDDLRDRENGRPPRDWAAWEKQSRGRDDNPLFAGVQDYSRGAGSSWKFHNINDDVRRDLGRLSRDLDTYRQQRIKTETAAIDRPGDRGREPDRVRTLKPPIGDERGIGDRGVRETGPGIDNRPDSLKREVPRENNRNPQDLPGPLNDIRTRPAPERRDPTDRPKLERDNPGPLNEIRDVPKDLPKTTPRVNDDRPPTPRPRIEPRDVTPRETPKVTPRDIAPRPVPRETPKVTPPRETPKAAPRETPRETPRPVPRNTPRDVPKAAPVPRTTPQPMPKPDRPERSGGGRPDGGGKSGGGDRPKGRD